MVLTGIAVAIAVAAVIVAVVLATKGSGSPSSTQLPGVPAASTFSTEATASESTPIESASTESATTETSATTIESSQAEQVLNEYTQDYANEDPEGLKGLFAEGFAREEENKPSEDAATAIATYERQFSKEKEPSYTLSETKIEPGVGEASATARYSITDQDGTVTGSITFHLVEQEEKVLIDKITVRPSQKPVK